MLHNAILDKAPKTQIPSNARLDSLRLLYQAHVDPDLVIPGQTKFIQTPRVVKLENLKDEDMEDLRLTLQAYAPKVFVHSIPMTHKVLSWTDIKLIIAVLIVELYNLILGLYNQNN
ncbi:uncharacterized protein MELLADRAFT_104590 [Melampsora larici-populina 98AG31]|uniref:Uncharacterized protein n=1 Tax=Melampsora larici-populina (strain 98AG31 / pathotype 3-4-7) TaxID=747676 RepID=F4RF83_MELLP|nr:uncharacterized protein MELLADRAFT_104590 [Melampsora larici-populina 98AG31]EGG08978.1 hypothetical protein MELLADRAFT_104590 [Melampsora larici-populina 98AG31]